MTGEGKFDRNAMSDRLAETRRVYRAIFDDTEDGKKVLGDLFHICCAGRTTFDVNSRDQTLINEGKRQVFLHIVSLVNASDKDIWYFAEQRVEESRSR